MSEFHPSGPWGPKDITDPAYWHEQQELRKKGSSGGGGILGLAALPMVLPLIGVIGSVLYPLAALATGAVWFVGHSLSQALGLKDLPMYAVTFGPALAVLWFAVRWDTWLAQNFVYWLIRHIARNILFVVMMIILSNVDSLGSQSDAAILSRFFQNHEQLGVTAVLLAVFNYLPIGKGVVKTIWRAGLKIARLRPARLSR